MPRPRRTYTCEKCGFSTHHKSTFDRHDKRKTACFPQGVTTILEDFEPNVADSGPNVADSGPNVADSGPNVADSGPNVADFQPPKITCEKCSRVFSCNKCLTRHLNRGKCVPRFACADCGRQFKDRHQNHNHKRGGKCVPIRVIGDHNITINGDNNTVNVNVQLKDFGKECLEKVLTDEIREWISSMSSFPAKQLGLYKAVWCNKDVPENHNVKEQSIKRRDCSIRKDDTWVSILMTDLVQDIRRELDKISMRHPDLNASRNVDGMRLVIRDRVVASLRSFMDEDEDAQIESRVSGDLAKAVKLEDQTINRDLKLLVKAAEGAREKPLRIPRPMTDGILDFHDVSWFSSSRMEEALCDGHNPEEFSVACLCAHFQGDSRNMSVFPRKPSSTVSVFVGGAWTDHGIAEFVPLLIAKSRSLMERCVANRQRLLESGEKVSVYGAKASQIDEYVRIGRDIWDRFASVPGAITPRVGEVLSQNAARAYRVLVSRAEG